MVGNKVTGAADLDFLRTEIGEDLVGALGSSGHVRAGDRGASREIAGLEQENAAVLDALRAVVDEVEQDWERHRAVAVRFHLGNAAARADAEPTRSTRSSSSGPLRSALSRS